MSRTKMKIHAALLSAALMLPAGSAFAVTHHRHRHHYSQTRGALVGAAAGAIVDHHHPLTGALVGAGVGTAVQVVRNKKQ